MDCPYSTDIVVYSFIITRSRLIAFYLAGVTALILTALVTLMLSRQILSPVKALTEGTQALKLPA